MCSNRWNKDTNFVIKVFLKENNNDYVGLNFLCILIMYHFFNLDWTKIFSKKIIFMNSK